MLLFVIDVDDLPGVGPIVALTYRAAVHDDGDLGRAGPHGRHAAVPGWPAVRGCPAPADLVLPISRMGLEGIVSKRLGSAYASTRTPNWLKIKKPEFRAALMTLPSFIVSSMKLSIPINCVLGV